MFRKPVNFSMPKRGKKMSILLKYWLKGWLIMVYYFLFSLILGIFFVPINLLLSGFSFYENAYLVAAVNFLIWIVISPFVFYLAGSFSGLFTNPHTHPQKPLRQVDPNTGVVTEFEQ